jgi:hypothetical protein
MFQIPELREISDDWEGLKRGKLMKNGIKCDFQTNNEVFILRFRSSVKWF